MCPVTCSSKRAHGLAALDSHWHAVVMYTYMDKWSMSWIPEQAAQEANVYVADLLWACQCMNMSNWLVLKQIHHARSLWPYPNISQPMWDWLLERVGIQSQKKLASKIWLVSDVLLANHFATDFWGCHKVSFQWGFSAGAVPLWAHSDMSALPCECMMIYKLQILVMMFADGHAMHTSVLCYISRNAAIYPNRFTHLLLKQHPFTPSNSSLTIMVSLRLVMEKRQLVLASK